MVFERVAGWFVGVGEITSSWCFTGFSAASTAPPLASPESVTANICYEITTPLNSAGPSKVTDVTTGISASVSVAPPFSSPASAPASPEVSTGRVGLFVAEDTIKGDGSGTMRRIAQALEFELVNLGLVDPQNVVNLTITPLNLVQERHTSHGRATKFVLCTGSDVTADNVCQALSNNLLVGHWTGGDGRWTVVPEDSTPGQFTITWSAGEDSANS